MPIIILRNCVYTVHWIQWLVVQWSDSIIQEVGKKSGNCVARVYYYYYFKHTNGGAERIYN